MFRITKDMVKKPEELQKRLFPNRNRSPGATRIARGREIMTENKTITPLNTGAPAETAVMNILSNLGLCYCPEPHDFSLLKIQSDTEEIHNENIMPDFNEIGCPQNIPADKSFKNRDDSFYNIDDRRPRKEQQRYQQQKEGMTHNNSISDSVATDLLKYHHFDSSPSAYADDSNEEYFLQAAPNAT